ANPGDTITFEVLATDGRAVKPRPLKIYWLPVVCLNPREDFYYLCFGASLPGVDAGATLSAPFPAGSPDGGLGAADAGAAGFGNALQQIPTGIDLGPYLPQGTRFSFQMPANAIQPRQGSPPY